MSVSIIIPTAGAPDRHDSLLRAIQTILDQDQAGVIPIVIVNGERYDRDLIQTLRLRRDLRFFHLEQPSLPAAINFGRRQVDTPFFGFLDDDDIYHAWAVRERLVALRSATKADAVVSWGEREIEGRRERVPGIDVWQPDDPASVLPQGCWLASCSGLFRTETVSPDYFDRELKHLEWTSVALRLALDRSLIFLESEKPHFLIADTPTSLSKSPAYFFGMEQSFDRLLALPLPPAVRKGFIRRKMDLRHHIAEHFRAKGDLGLAWKHHLRTFLHRQGLRYLPSTAYLLRATFDHLVTK